MEPSTCNNSVAVISSLSDDSNDDYEVRSMTAKGINHMCSELLELKTESIGDFHRIVISNYLSFTRIFEEVKCMEDDLIQLKSHVSSQTNVFKDFLDGMDLKPEPEETADSSPERSECSEIARLVDLEAHIYDVSKALDTLICENRIDEALEAIKIEDENFHRLKVEEDYPLDVVLLYDCLISDKRARIKLRSAQVPENTRTPASKPHEAPPEL